MIYETNPEPKRIKLENKNLRVIILPHMGGRIISLFHKEKSFEAAAQPGAGTDGTVEGAFGDNADCMRKETTELGMNGGMSKETVELGTNESIYKEIAESGARENFAPYAYGMDDAFPNIVEEDFTWKGQTRHYPDHGEIWRGDFRVIAYSHSDAVLVWESQDFGYRYEKKLCLEGDSLRIHYRITNRGGEELPAIWTWHGLMRYEEDMEIVLPKGVEQFRNVLEGAILGKEGTIYPLKNESYGFTKVPRAKSCSMVKYYVESQVTEGRCGFYYPSQGISYMLKYDAEKLPYLGVWITAGGFQGDYNCALEPTNGFYDSISKAAGNGKLPVLGAGERLEFELLLTLTAETSGFLLNN